MQFYHYIHHILELFTGTKKKKMSLSEIPLWLYLTQTSTYHTYVYSMGAPTNGNKARVPTQIVDMWSRRAKAEQGGVTPSTGKGGTTPGLLLRSDSMGSDATGRGATPSARTVKEES